MNHPCSRGCGYPYRRPAAANNDQGNCSRPGTGVPCSPQRPMPCAQPAPEPRYQARPASCAPQSPIPCPQTTPEPRCQARPVSCTPANSCGCTMNWNPKDFPVAMGYVPMQKWSTPMNLCRGLQCGTIFEDLNKPFCGKGGACR